MTHLHKKKRKDLKYCQKHAIYYENKSIELYNVNTNTYFIAQIFRQKTYHFDHLFISQIIIK